MNRLELISRTAEKTGCSSQEMDEIYQALIDVLAAAMTSGEDISLDSDFGEFVVKKRLYQLQENSPRTQKTPRYQVTFRSSGKLKRNLKCVD